VCVMDTAAGRKEGEERRERVFSCVCVGGCMCCSFFFQFLIFFFNNINNDE